jgi:hypothetical protein
MTRKNLPLLAQLTVRRGMFARDLRFSGWWRSTFQCSKNTRRKPMP